MNVVPENKKDMRFVYFGRIEKLALNRKEEEYTQWLHEGVVCVGYLLNDDGSLTVAVSFCSPNDSFSKKKARLIIRQRMDAGKSDAIAPGDKEFALMTYEETIKAIEDYISEIVSDELPQNYADEDLPMLAGVRMPRWLANA